MSKPKQRELDAVSKLPMLSEQEVATLYQILGVLGFDIGTIALFWEKTEAETRQLFRVDVHGSRKVYEFYLTGADLAWWCNLIHLRPGVVQRRFNFDESNLRLKKQGRSSTRVTAGWIGPPLFATKGGCVEGRAFVELAGMVRLPERSTLDSAMLGQIAAGKYPVRLPLLRDLMMAIEEAGISHPKVDIIENALTRFPPGVRTLEEVFEAITTPQEGENIQTSTSGENLMQPRIVKDFREEVARRGILPALQQLHAESADVKQLCHEWNINVHGEIFPGCFEVIVWSAAFENATKRWPHLTKPLTELGGWLAVERRKDEENAAGRKVQKADSAVLPSKQEPKPVAKPATNLAPPAQLAQSVRTAVPVRAQAPKPPKPVVAPAAPPRPVPAKPEKIETDELGVTWNWTRHQVILGAVSISMTPLSDTRLQGDVRTVSKRVYDSLCAVRKSVSEDAVYFCQQIGVERLWFAGLVDSASQLTPVILKGILDKLRTNYDVNLTPAQLFCLTPLPEMVTAEEQGEEGGEAAAVTPVELLFLLGDARAGYRWASLLQKYRAVLKWFRQNYGVTDEDIVRIEEGKIGVPVSVHHVLMWKVRERIEGYEGVIIPRSYEWLLRNPHSQPVQDGTFILDENEIPNKNWLRQ